MKTLHHRGRLQTVRAAMTIAFATAALVAIPHPASSAIDFAAMYRTIPSAPSATRLKVLEVDGDGIPDALVIGASKHIWFHRGLAGGGHAPAVPLISFSAFVTLWDVGDLNNDGKIDLVVADPHTAWSILANGDGTFQPRRAILSQFSGSCLRLGDLDVDGKLDLVAGLTFGSFYTLRGLGDGGFQLQSIISGTPVFPVDFAIADFNGDSKPDVMALDAGGAARTVNFFRGLGGGALGTPTIISMQPGRPEFIRVADVDQDGRPDAVVGNGTAGMTILYGVPSGSSFGRLDLPDYATVIDVLSIDLDADGKLELILDSTQHEIIILGRTGPRSYAPLRDYPAGLYLGEMGITDVDHDGFKDLITCNRETSRVAVLRGRGGLEFGDGYEVATLEQMWGLDVGDLNGDLLADVATMSTGTSITAVHLNRGDGSFLPMLSVEGPLACCGRVYSRLADVNDDGRLDFVGMVESHNRLDVVLGDGTGQFSSRSYTYLGTRPYAMTVADFNEDGISDVAAACDARINICLGTLSGQFSPPTSLNGHTKYVRAADFNLDGHADLIATNSHPHYESVGDVAVFLGQGDGTFTALPTFYAGNRPTNIAVGDVNGDSIPDIAVANLGAPSIACFLGAGNGSFIADSVITGVWSSSLEFVDLDGDGWQELAGVVPNVAAVRVWPGPGAGRGGPFLDFGTRKDPSLMRFADLDHDGRIDIVVEHESRNDFDVLSNRSVPLLTPVVTSPGSANKLAFRKCSWDESSGAFRATLAVAGTSLARLEFIDVLGRRVASDSWVPSSNGLQEHRVAARGRITNGVLWARLSQNGESATKRVVVLR